jgi:peroxiredoxin
VGVAAVALAALGVYAGSALRGTFHRDDADAVVLRKAFVPGAHFPTVELVSADGSRTTTRELFRDRGAVVLFLDLECESCHSMVSQWQRYEASDSLGGIPLIGIAMASPDSVAAFRREHDVTIPVYSDTEWTFMRTHRVDSFPLCLVVSRSGVVKSAEIDAHAPVVAADVRRWLAE